MQFTTMLAAHDPYADFGDDADGLPDGVAFDICPCCGPVLLNTRDGRLEAHRRDGTGLCLCTPVERLDAEAAQDRRRRQLIDERARRARNAGRHRASGLADASRSIPRSATAPARGGKV